MKNNNKNYSEIVEKRKATIEKKREKTVEKKQAILEKLNNDIDYLNKVKSAVEKRKDTISKKEFIKDLFNAGIAYGEEKEKGYQVKTTQSERDRKKYEKGEALGAKFKVNKYYDNLDMLMNTEVGNKNIRIVVPHDVVIKQYIDSNLRKQIEINNSKEKLKCYIAIQYKLCVDNKENVN